MVSNPKTGTSGKGSGGSSEASDGGTIQCVIRVVGVATPP
jgi:hypothetical protein